MSWIADLKLLFGLSCLILMCSVIVVDCKGCLGTNNGLSHQGSIRNRYNTYKDMYSNCTYVEGNLEIIFLEGEEDHDLSFLSDIREVSGYVLIYGNFMSYIPLSSLRIIRGTNLYMPGDKGYSLFIANNYKPGDEGRGLKELGFLSLNEILAGSVFLFNNNMMCYENTIDWEDILSGEGADYEHHYDSIDKHRECGECDPSCFYDIHNTRHCWGEGPNQCQRLNRVTCSRQCDFRCYGPTPQDCCHTECAGGCDGPLATECWACLHFDNSGKCEAYCPPEMIYNQKTYQMEFNPLVKYAYGSKCVSECPIHLVQNKGACIQDCGHGMMTSEDRKCEECDGPCPKTCTLTTEITSLNIHNLTECTVIKGSIIIYQHSFDGDLPFNITPMHPSELLVLESVQEVTGYIKIQGNHDDFKDLSFLRNLRSIDGQQLDEYRASLHAVSTSLESLNLQSLTTVKNGRVLFLHNRYLCFARYLNWTRILKDNDPNEPPEKRIYIQGNAEEEWCKNNNHVCHPECSDAGCWGPGDRNCFECQNYHLDHSVCLKNCDSLSGLFESERMECKRCHSECRDGCTGGDGSENCTRCKHVRDGPFCKKQCPESKYRDENNVCQSCHPNCVSNCSGPHNIMGEGGCNQCALAVVDTDGNITECLPPRGECPDRYYKIRALAGPMLHHMVCRACHEECKRCSYYSAAIGHCHECINYEQDGDCVSNCSAHYFADNVNSKCVACHDTCTECRGPTSSDCFDCKYYKLYWDIMNIEENPRFNCTDKCPEFAPIRLADFGEVKESVCVTEPHAQAITGTRKLNIKLIVGLIVGGLLLLSVVAILFGYFWKQRARSEENKMRLTARMSGLEESEPLTPTEAKPDMATLRLIKESELRRGNIIGSGAFGTVYKGFWLPEGDPVKIPVAIKVLQEGTSPSQNKELLEEARIMASVYHPCCIRILAVCMTTQMMLVTQLMPLGCLLEYVRKNKMNIGSKVLLNWCTQIARGMSYLEERQIVHRDLAARNVLVQSPGQVKITDFGLAKLLDFNEEEFHASGGKMPIKWLALECIQHRIFTHKSDVWSFGVTIWELFTYGQRPYESVRARDIPDILEKGERLPQPSICTIDVYMIMIKCWMLDAESRPSFKELADEFAKMARDPGRYLVIHGDKLMRLPSHNQDTYKDLLRNMSIASDTPEDFRLIEADDYLTPRGSTLEPPPTPSRHASMNGKLERIREDSKDSSTYDDRHNTTNTSLSTSAGSREGSRERDYPAAAGRRDKKYSGLEAAAAARRQRETAPNGRDSLSGRYCSDPCKHQTDPWGDKTMEGMEFPPGEFPDMPAPPTPIEAKPPVDLDVRLPVDEDDYLQPKSSNPRAYMDLVDGPDYLASDENSNPTTDSGYASRTDPDANHQPGGIHQPGAYLDMSSPVRTNIDNPEYFDRQIPRPPPFSSVNIDNLKTEKQPNHVHMESDYTPPENEYYNDFNHRNSRNPNTSVFIDPRSESRV